MPRDLSGSLPADIAAPITRPGYLVEIGFADPLRLSSRGDQSYDGLVWTGGRLGKLAITEAGGSLELMNTDLLAGALVMGEGVADRAVRVWAFYGDDPADVAALFDGVADGAEIGADRVRLTLAAQNARTLFSPRRFVGPSAGFSRLTQAGTRLAWGGQTIILERA